MPLIGYFCAAILAHSLCVTPVATPARTVATGTTELVFHNGTVDGVYIDDQVPHKCAVATEDAILGWSNIIVGVSPSQPKKRCRGVLNAQEWYPYNSPYRPSLWGPMPNARAYILQRTFSFNGPPPNANEQRRLLRDALKHHPELILWY